MPYNVSQELFREIAVATQRLEEDLERARKAFWWMSFAITFSRLTAQRFAS
jgi:hypothetical protein